MTMLAINQVVRSSINLVAFFLYNKVLILILKVLVEYLNKIASNFFSHDLTAYYKL